MRRFATWVLVGLLSLCSAASAAIVQTGTTLEFTGVGPASSGTISSTITVPADAEIVVGGCSAYSTTANFMSGGNMTFTKGGTDTTMSKISGGDGLGASAWGASLFYLVLPDTGTNKSWKWTWAAAATDSSVVCSLTFWKGIDTASPVRGSGGGQAGALPYTTSTITAASGDLIVAWVGFFTGGSGTIDSWSNLTLLTQITSVASGDGAWATGSPSGNTTVAASTGTNADDGGIVAISLKASGGGGGGTVRRKSLVGVGQ